MLHNAQLTNFFKRKKQKKGWGSWITETEQIQEMTQNPCNEVNVLPTQLKYTFFLKKEN